MSAKKSVSLAKIGPLLDTNEDSFNFYIDHAFMDFMAENASVTDPREIFKAGANWFRSIVKRNINGDF